MVNGQGWFPPAGGFKVLLNLFPTILGVEIAPPFVAIRVHTLPPKPWPLTIGGLPVRFSTHTLTALEPLWDNGNYPTCGKGPRAMNDLDLQLGQEFSQDIIRRVMVFFQDAKIKFRSIFWFGSCWRVTLTDPVDLRVLPCTVGRQLVIYELTSEIAYPVPSASRNKVPQGVEFDNTLYASSPNALLRPGIMLGSSIVTVTADGKTEELFKTTTSGILVANRHGDLFITVATHGFENDGLVYHPDPRSGIVIGKISHSLPETDISFAKLNPGLRYINETFDSTKNPLGVRANRISLSFPSDLRTYDTCSMNTPFSGRCDGHLLAAGEVIPACGNAEHVPHMWLSFESGDEPVEGTCGSPIIRDNGDLVGFFRYKMEDSNYCYAVSALTLQEHGYEICGGERTF